MRTRKVAGFSYPRIATCDVIALFAHGYSKTRMASALRKMAAHIETTSDPNDATTPLPVARYHTADEPGALVPPAKPRRNVAAIG